METKVILVYLEIMVHEVKTVYLVSTELMVCPVSLVSKGPEVILDLPFCLEKWVSMVKKVKLNN